MSNDETARKPWAGPIREGMAFRFPDWWSGRTEIVGMNGYSLQLMLESRDQFIPVRPIDSDSQAWERFKFPSQTPDTGPKQFKVGQVYASFPFSNRPYYSYVFRVRNVRKANSQHLDVEILAGRAEWRMTRFCNSEWTSRAVLLFDVDGVPTASPAERQLAECWERCPILGKPSFIKLRPEAYWKCAGCNAYAVYARNVEEGHDGACITCASWLKVFADSAPIEPVYPHMTVAEPVIAPCPTCTHKHLCPCTEKSPNGEFDCPCGHFARASVRQGEVYQHKQNDQRFGNATAGLDMLGTDRATLLANLDREKPPGRRTHAVRDIYRGGDE